MNRFASVLAAGQSPLTMRALAEGFLRSVIESEVEGQNAQTDPAVLLFAGYISFVCHADFASPDVYRKLVDICE